jgi:hypothetical protein
MSIQYTQSNISVNITLSRDVYTAMQNLASIDGISAEGWLTVQITQLIKCGQIELIRQAQQIMKQIHQYEFRTGDPIPSRVLLPRIAKKFSKEVRDSLLAYLVQHQYISVREEPNGEKFYSFNF